jgi:hypothetical protein
MSQDIASNLSNLHAPTMAFEKIRTKFLLQLPDLSTERRLGDVQAICRLAEAAELGDVDQRFELDYIHQHGTRSEGATAFGMPCLGGQFNHILAFASLTLRHRRLK